MKKLPWYAFLFPLTQLLLLGLLLFMAASYHMFGMTLVILCIILSALCVITDILLLSTLKKVTEKRLLQEKEILLAQALQRQAQRSRDLQREKAGAAALRREIAGQLHRAEELLEQRQTETAREQLEDVVERLRSARRCCEHPVADAVVEEKLALCARENIPVTCHLQVPRELPLSGVELCAMFSNGMDNAIAACRRCPGENRFIELRCRVLSGFLLLRITNSALPPEKQCREGLLAEHGWGLPIMRSIAERDGGRLETGWKNGVFEMTAWLKIPLPQEKPFVT